MRPLLREASVRGTAVVASLLVFLAGFAWSVFTKEEQLKNGAACIVRLAPRDPRAFLLGDHMVLNYAMNREVDKALREREQRALPADGVAVVRLDANGVASFVRLDDGGPLEDDERRLHFRVRRGEASVAARAFYFQEGTAKNFERAEYGELRVDAQGRSLLAHLLDGNLDRIRPRKHAP